MKKERIRRTFRKQINIGKVGEVKNGLKGKQRSREREREQKKKTKVIGIMKVLAYFSHTSVNLCNNFFCCFLIQ